MSDSGSIPAKAVIPGETEAGGAGRRPFAEVLSEAYGWTIDVDGYLAGLVAGDMGYDQTDMKLCDLWVDAQVAEDKRERLPGASRDWPVHAAMDALIAAAAAEIGIAKADAATPPVTSFHASALSDGTPAPSHTSHPITAGDEGEAGVNT